MQLGEEEEENYSEENNEENVIGLDQIFKFEV